MSIALLLAGIGFLIFVWSCVLHQRVYYALIDTFPLELRDDHTSRFAIHAIALSPSTPLALQVDYVKSQAGICLAFLAGSLSGFLFGNVALGLGWLVVSLVGVAVAFTSCKAYKGNRNRRTRHRGGEEES